MITLFSKPSCPQCEQTKTMLANADIAYMEVDLTRSPAAMKRVMEMGHRSAPVVLTESGESWSGFQRERIAGLMNQDDLWT